MFYKKKRKRGRIVFVLCALLLFAGFAYGYMSNNTPNSKPIDITKQTGKDQVNRNNPAISNEVDEKTDNNEDITGGDRVAEIAQNNDKDTIQEDFEIVFKTHYISTNEEDIKKAKIPITIVGASKDELEVYIKRNYSDWDMKDINTKSVLLYKEVSGYKPNYFVIQSKDGYIVVYKINKAGEKELYDETGISTSILSEMDKQKLIEGIVAKTEDELFNIIEDYSS